METPAPRRRGPQPKVPLEHLLSICERFYEKNGFVKWADVAEALGISRQGVHLRLKTAVERGEISQGLVERFQSMTSRAAVSRENKENRQDQKRLRLSVLFTAENLQWLQEEAVVRGVRTNDIINGLVTRAREAKPVGTF